MPRHRVSVQSDRRMVTPMGKVEPVVGETRTLHGWAHEPAKEEFTRFFQQRLDPFVLAKWDAEEEAETTPAESPPTGRTNSVEVTDSAGRPGAAGESAVSNESQTWECSICLGRHPVGFSHNGVPVAAPTPSVACLCSPDDQEEWCPHHGRLEYLREELTRLRNEERYRREAADSSGKTVTVSEAQWDALTRVVETALAMNNRYRRWNYSAYENDSKEHDDLSKALDDLDLATPKGGHGT